MAKAGTAYVEVLGDFSKLRRQLAVEMAKLDKDIKVDVDVDRAAFAGLNRDLDRTERSAAGANRGLAAVGKTARRSGADLVSFSSRIPILQLGLMGTAAYNAAGGVVALAGALAPLSGLLGAIGPLATTAAQAKLTLGLATNDLKQAVGGLNEELDEESEAFERLSPEGQRFARTLQKMKPAFRDVQRAAQKGLFPGLERGIKSAMRNLPVLQRIVGRTADAFGDLAERAGRRLGSQEWGKDLETQGARNERTLRRLGDSGLDLAEIFKDVTLAAGPLVDRLTKWVGALTEGWKESANAARESGRLQRFFEDAGTTFFKTVRILRDLAVSFKNIGSAARQAFGNELLSGIERGAAGLRKWTESAKGQRELVAIFTDIGDRLKRLGGFIKDLFGDFRQMRAEGQSAGDALGQVFLTALSKVIEKAGELGVKFAKAFVRGFIDADVGGKLILAAFALSKFGLLGRTVGAVFGAGVAQGAATGVVAGAGAGAAGGGLLGTLRSKLLPAAKRVGLVGVGIALADSVMGEFSRRVDLKSDDVFKSLKSHKGPSLGGFVEGLFPAAGKTLDFLTDNKSTEAAKKLEPALRAIVEQSKAITPKRAQELRDAIGDLDGVAAGARRGMEQIVAQSEALGSFRAEFGFKLDADTPLRAIRRISAGFSDLQSHTTASLRTTLRIVDRNARAIAQSLGTNSKAGRQALRKNFQLAIGDIRSLMSAGVVSADAGARAIRKIVVEALGTFGIKGKAAIRLAGIFGARGLQNLGAGNSISGADLGDRRSGNRRQRGGPIDIGKPVGDSVPAVLERGEYVLNRKAVQAVGKDKLDHLNFKQAKRFQSGGIVALGRKLQREGYAVGEHPAFGGVGGSHTGTSYHYRGQAIDVNADNFPGGEMGALDKLYARLKRLPGVVELLWRVKDHFDHLHVAMSGAGGALAGLDPIKLGRHRLTGEPSALKAQVAGALETVRAVGQSTIDGAMANMTMEGPETAFTGGGNAKANRALGRRMASQMFGWTGGQWSALDRLWTGESGWENVMNTAGSGATGIPQALPGSKMASEGADWRTNPETQIRWGLKYIRDRYGDPVNAYNQWLARDPHWYAQGGIVEGPNGRNAHKVKLPEALRKTLKKIGKTKKKAGRAKLLEGFVKKLEKLGLPKNLMGDINRLDGDHSLFEQYATSARDLTVENDDGTSIPGVIKGLSEIGWTAKDLDAQFKMRNRLVRAREIVVKRRAQVTRAFDIAKNRLKDVSKGGKTPAGWKGVNPARDPVEKWNKQGQPKRLQRMREWRRKHGSLPGTREFDPKTGRLEAQPASKVSALKKLVPALRDQKKLLNTGIQTNIRVPLEELQGIGGSTKHLRSPWPIGTIPAGSIFQTQLRLQQLGAKPDVTDSSGGALEAGDSGRADRLAELLGIERQRSLVRDIEIAELLRTARQPPFAGVFHQGGVVPGPVGAERVALVTGGEVITPPQSKSGSRDNDRFRLIVEDHRVRVYRNDVEMIVDQKLRGVSRGVGRVPGLAGSLKP